MANVANSSSVFVDSEEVPMNTAPFRDEDEGARILANEVSPPGYEDTYKIPQKQEMYRKPAVMPPDYLLFSILVTIFCCSPCGIVALVYSSEVRIRNELGDHERASSFSRQAKKWAIWGLVIGIVLIGSIVVIEIVGMMSLAALASANQHT